MIALQIISKVLNTKDYSIVSNNLLTEDYFIGYESEYNFIKNHYEKFGNVPDIATFLSKFPQITLVDVEESDNYLVDTIREEYLYHKSVPIIQKSAELLKNDSNAAVEFLLNSIKALQPSYELGGIDIISDAMQRYELFVDRKNNPRESFFTCGFPELDDLIHGIQRSAELLVIFARTNQGKSWVLEKMCTHVWQIGYNVGYVSPEMDANSIGYRFDTLYKHYSNTGLMLGKDDVDQNDYQNYVSDLADSNNKFIVSTPIDFNKNITVTKLKNWIVQNKLDLIAIDGITYLSDERYKRGDNKTTTLTNISEDLMELSLEMKVPVLVVVQANRSGVKEDDKDGTPELESIRDSDGISHNASKVLSLRQLQDNILEIGIKKQRFGQCGGKLKYRWDIDTGSFEFIPSYDDAQPQERTIEEINTVKKKFKDISEVF